MIFVYPAIVSQNVDDKIGIAASKAIEQFFLLHLQEAFQNGDIRLRTIFNNRTRTYGSIQLSESVKHSGQLLKESFDVNQSDDSIKGIIDTQIKKSRTVVEDARSQAIKIFTSVERAIANRKIADMIDATADALKNLGESIEVLDYLLNSLSDYREKKMNQLGVNKKDVNNFTNDQQSRLNTQLKSVQTIIRELNDNYNRLEKHRGKSPTEQDTERIKEVREKEKSDRERRKEELPQYETHGRYKIEPLKGISLQPTMANVTVPLHYVGGPHEKENMTISPNDMKQDMAIGVKMLPMKFSNFDHLEEAILNDYFTNTIQSLWRSFSRAFLRRALGGIKRFLQKHLKIDILDNPYIGIRGHMDPVKSNILLAPNSYVKASSFEKRSGSSNFYRYTSAVVIFNKDELMKEEGENFFLNKNQLTRMFRMGWNAFCILDNIKNEAIFVSSLDGGHMHVMPYSYIFNLFGMDTVYKDIDELRRRATPFRISKGNFNVFKTRLKREEKLLKTARAKRS